jgi:hypothetical protein
MRKAAVMMFGALAVLNFGIGPAAAIPFFQAQFKEMYVAGSDNQAFKDAFESAKCNTCHKGKKKTDRNPYGEELAKLLDKKADAKNAEKVKEALMTVGDLKNADGKTYGELIKEGKLPGGAPE